MTSSGKERQIEVPMMGNCESMDQHNV